MDIKYINSYTYIETDFKNEKPEIGLLELYCCIKCAHDNGVF